MEATQDHLAGACTVEGVKTSSKEQSEVFSFETAVVQLPLERTIYIYVHGKKNLPH